jgi:hypothetical protein
LPLLRWLGSWPLVIWLVASVPPVGLAIMRCADHWWSGPTGVT